MLHELRVPKLELLRFIQLREVIDIMDLVNEYGFSYDSARNKLYRLEKQKLVEKLGIHRGAYCLTNEAYKKLEYYEQVLHNSSHKP